jgi:hypothetical protein
VPFKVAPRVGAVGCPRCRTGGRRPDPERTTDQETGLLCPDTSELEGFGDGGEPTYLCVAGTAIAISEEDSTLS